MLQKRILKFVFFLLLIAPSNVFSQNEGLVRSFIRLGFPEKVWVITHPFIAKKTWKITKEALRISDEIKRDSLLDGDPDGGQVDAFRHTYWMASLTQKISCKKARRLGKAHEKVNYRNFKKGRKEENNLPDEASSDMDLRNNELGIALGIVNKNLSQNELVTLVRNAILEGKAWKIYKNKKGESLDCNGNIILAEKRMALWKTLRCLVESSKKRN
jgi:hypothetical protein